MKNTRSLMLLSGLFSTLMYIATDIISGLISPGYSFNSQTVSELSAIGAPTRTFWQLATFIVNPLLILFGQSILRLTQTDGKLRLRFTAYCITALGVLGFIWLLFPMNLRGNIGSTGDTMHLVMAAVTVLLMIVMLVSGVNAFGTKFRVYTISTLIWMATFGFLTAQQTAQVAAQLPTPWMGITERCSSYSPLIWIAVLSWLLYKQRQDSK